MKTTVVRQQLVECTKVRNVLDALQKVLMFLSVMVMMVVVVVMMMMNLAEFASVDGVLATAKQAV